MPTTVDTIIANINQYINNYANTAFQNNNLKTILLLMCEILSGSSPGVSFFASTFQYSSSDFSTATNLPIPILNGLSLVVEMKGIGKLIKGTDWQDLAGGGITMLIPGFDATANSYDIFVTVKAN